MISALGRKRGRVSCARGQTALTGKKGRQDGSPKYFLLIKKPIRERPRGAPPVGYQVHSLKNPRHIIGKTDRVIYRNYQAQLSRREGAHTQKRAQKQGDKRKPFVFLTCEHLRRRWGHDDPIVRLQNMCRHRYFPVFTYLPCRCRSVTGRLGMTQQSWGYGHRCRTVKPR